MKHVVLHFIQLLSYYFTLLVINAMQPAVYYYQIYAKGV